MLETSIDILIKALPAVASAAVLFICSFAFTRMKDFKNEHSSLIANLKKAKDRDKKINDLIAIQENQNAVLRELMGVELDREHKRLVEQGYASPSEKISYERKYNAYHGIYGNGTRTAFYEDVMKMNSYPS